MAEPNHNYVLGRGRTYFNRFAPGTMQGTGERYLGSTPAFSFNVSVESLDHMSKEGGIDEKDASVVTSVTRAGQVTCDDVSDDNMALFAFGTKATVTVAATSDGSDSFAGVMPGMYYQLGESDAMPTGATNVKNVVVQVGGDGTPDSGTPAAAGTDFEIDNDLGRLYVLPGSEVITADSTIYVTFGTDGYTFNQVISGNTPIYGSIRFISENIAGANKNYLFPYVKLTPNGDHELKSDNWQQMQFSLEILKRRGREAVYCDGQPFNIAA